MLLRLLRSSMKSLNMILVKILVFLNLKAVMCHYNLSLIKIYQVGKEKVMVFILIIRYTATTISHNFTKWQIFEGKVDYNEVIGCKGKKVSKRNIERLKLLEKDLIYPPRLRFQFVCTNQSLAKIVTKVETTLNGMSIMTISCSLFLLIIRVLPTVKA